MKQKDSIRKHLINVGSITPFVALAEYECMRLAARVGELRKDGMKIETIMTRQNGKRFGTYVYNGRSKA